MFLWKIRLKNFIQHLNELSSIKFVWKVMIQFEWNVITLCKKCKKQEANEGLNRSTGKYSIIFFFRFSPPVQ